MLADLIDHVNERGGAVLMHGEAGVGKSALLAAVGMRARAYGMLVLSTTGVQSEAHLPFAGRHQRLRPSLAEVDELPAPQRDAVLTAFGVIAAPAPDLFLIALAALELLAGDAARTPLVLIAEDAHWLDRSTCDVLAFIARRL